MKSVFEGRCNMEDGTNDLQNIRTNQNFFHFFHLWERKPIERGL